MDFVLAASLLLSDPGSGGLKDAHTHGKAVAQIAVQWEILGNNESVQIDELRCRYRRLKDCPRLAEALRMPSPEMCQQLLTINRQWRDRVEERILLEPHRAEDLRAVLGEIKQLYLFWDAMHTASCPYFDVVNRREALAYVRDSLGNDAFRELDLPPAVPYWRGEP